MLLIEVQVVVVQEALVLMVEQVLERVMVVLVKLIQSQMVQLQFIMLVVVLVVIMVHMVNIQEQMLKVV